MKEHYVSYSQSVKLKEFGFDVKCRHFYNINTQKFLRDRSKFNYNLDYTKCSAPRLDQAATWLRDCKGIHVSPNPYYICHRDEYGNIYEERYLWSFELMRVPMRDYRTIGDGGDYESYEEALSAGISKALELLGKEDKP